MSVFPLKRNPRDAERIMIQVRLPRTLVRQIDHWAIDRDLNRQQAYEYLLRRGLEAPDYVYVDAEAS